MKHIINRIALLLLMAFSFVGCESYLDKSPDMGLSDEDIYKDFYSMRGYLDQIYRGDDYLLINIHSINKADNQYALTGNLSDEYDRVQNDNKHKLVNSGNWLRNSDNSFEIGSKGSAIGRAYKGMRIVNRIIADIDKVETLSDEERNMLLGQAHFFRAYFYFELMKRYGGMPALNTLLSTTSDLDLVRMTYQESNQYVIDDLNAAIGYLPEAWPTEEHGRPDRVSAMALKGMAQLYAASPLMQNGLDEIVDNGYGKAMAKEAAKSAQACIDAVDKHSYYRLMNTDEYRSIMIMDASLYSQPENLWFQRQTPGNMSAYVRAQWLTQPYDNKTGAEGTPYNAPTQNMVDMFERMGDDGVYYPITDSRSGYDLQDPYSNRDPRFTNNILYPGEQWGSNKAGVPYYTTTYAGGYSTNFITTNAFTNTAQATGYMCKKFIWEEASVPLFGATGFNLHRIASPYIRVAQVYLDLAEASFEATGSATEVVEGCTLSAEQAINIVRRRAGITDLPSDIVSDPVKFREAYRRERAVELMFESHRWFDIRRWMIAVDLFSDPYPIKGIKATPKNHKYAPAQLKGAMACEYKLTDFDYEIVDVESEVRVFATRNYWYPFPLDEVAALYNLQQNPGW